MGFWGDLIWPNYTQISLLPFGNFAFKQKVRFQPCFLNLSILGVVVYRMTAFIDFLNLNHDKMK